MNLAYLLTGGNLGDRVANLQQAKALLNQHAGRVLAASSLYQTAAWGITDQPDFLNQVLLLQTQLSPERLLHTLLETETSMGRVREQKFGPRIIDIDLLLYNQQILNTPHLTLPHPYLHLRRFTLVPLTQLAPQLLHPVLSLPMAKLLEQCPDAGDVKKFSDA